MSILFSTNLETYTKGSQKEVCFNENNILLTNTVLCATDVSPSMVGRHRGFLSYFKKIIPYVYYPLCNTQTVVEILSVKLSETLKVLQQLCVENAEGLFQKQRFPCHAFILEQI